VSIIKAKFVQKGDNMFRKKIVALMMVTMIAAQATACGDKTANNVSVEATSVQEQTTAQATSSADQEASVKAAEEASKKAEEIKASMAAEISSLAAEEESKAEAASKAAAAEQASKEAEAASQAAAEAASAEAALAAAAAQVSQTIGANDEVITVIDDYGIESARMQYTANYAAYVELVRLTNELRESLGVAPLEMQENICIASCKKAVDYYLAGYYDGENHTMIDGRRWQSLFEDFNIIATARAENLARGPAYKTAQQMFEGWKNSPVHYENMINPAYTRIGVGSCGYVWFMDLANDG
jgi:uncharacterized protein YkwD